MKHISLALAQALGLHGTLTATAWTPAPNMPLEDWIRAGEALAAVESGASWWIGDWWAFGEHAYGNRKALVDREDWRGPAFDTCAAAARVSRDLQLVGADKFCLLPTTEKRRGLSRLKPTRRSTGARRRSPKPASRARRAS